jgi:hypothetical protein
MSAGTLVGAAVIGGAAYAFANMNTSAAYEQKSTEEVVQPNRLRTFTGGVSSDLFRSGPVQHLQGQSIEKNHLLNAMRRVNAEYIRDYGHGKAPVRPGWNKTKYRGQLSQDLWHEVDWDDVRQWEIRAKSEKFDLFDSTQPFYSGKNADSYMYGGRLPRQHYLGIV